MPDSPQATQAVEIKEPTGGVQHVYTNSIALTWSAFDLKIRFSEMTRFDAQTRKLTIDERVVVTMAWTEAKELLAMLSNAISAYENVNGPLNSPQMPPSIE